MASVCAWSVQVKFRPAVVSSPQSVWMSNSLKQGTHTIDAADLTTAGVVHGGTAAVVVGTHSVSSFVRYDTTADEPSTPNPCVTTGAGKETVVSMDIMSLPVPGSLHPSMIRSRSHQVAGAASSTRYPASVSSVYGSILGRPLTSTDWPIGAESIVISTIDGRISTASMMPQELPPGL